jgi:hypothetical protein
MKAVLPSITVLLPSITAPLPSITPSLPSITVPFLTNPTVQADIRKYKKFSCQMGIVMCNIVHSEQKHPSGRNPMPSLDPAARGPRLLDQLADARHQRRFTPAVIRNYVSWV